MINELEPDDRRRSFAEAKRLGFDLEVAIETSYELGQLEQISADTNEAFARCRRQLRALLTGHKALLELVMADVAFVEREALEDVIAALPRCGESLELIRKLERTYQRDFGHAVPPRRSPPTPTARNKTRRALERTWEMNSKE